MKPATFGCWFQPRSQGFSLLKKGKALGTRLMLVPVYHKRISKIGTESAIIGLGLDVRQLNDIKQSNLQKKIRLIHLPIILCVQNLNLAPRARVTFMFRWIRVTRALGTRLTKTLKTLRKKCTKKALETSNLAYTRS